MAKATAERVSTEMVDNYVFQRSLKAYYLAKEMVSGNVLEIGTGAGYGVKEMAPVVDHFTTIDQFECGIDFSKHKNVTFIKKTVPSLSGIADNTFDFVISFQVIEHIKDDHEYVKEIHRVLKKGGKFICTTPNIKTTLSRNPWHIREYTHNELTTIFKKYFSTVDTQGLYGNGTVMDYYNKNKESIRKIMRFDIFNLQYNLPAWMLTGVYDFMNNRNRKKLLNGNNELTSSITTNDFYLQDVDDKSLDLFYIGEK